MSSLPLQEQPTSRPGAQLRIEIHAGPLAGKGFPFAGNTISIGRAPENDISLDDSQVSRHHAILRRQGNEIILEDLGSTNGVFVNGERIYLPHVLQPTETISIGESVFGVTGFPAPSTVGMNAQAGRPKGAAPWQTYDSSAIYPPYTGQSQSSNWLLWSGLILLVILVLAIAGVSAFIFSSNSGSASVSVPVVVIRSPVSGSQVTVGQRVAVQATANDAQGVTRMELWVAGQKVAHSISPAPSGQSPFTSGDELAWTPSSEGTYRLEVRAFNSQGLQSAPAIVNITAVTDPLSAEATPTQTSTSTPIASGIPVGIVKTDLNVRNGPGTQYDVIGRLAAGTEVKIVGRNDAGSWWQIVHLDSLEGRGWVAAEYAPSQNAGGAPVIATPTLVPTETPIPTDTPTVTPTPTTSPPTATSTPTTAPPTSTPEPLPADTATLTPTATPPAGPSITFSADPLDIKEGECSTFSWLVFGVQAVYFEDQGVPGEDNGQPVSKEECPSNTHTYKLRVIKQNNEEETREITITVGEKPGAPANLDIDTIYSDGFDLGWDDNSDSEDGFRLYNADSNQILETFDKDKDTGDVTGLSCNTTYRLYLVAYNTHGESTPGNIVTEQTLSCP